MSEQSKNQASPNAQHNEQDLISLIKKLQEHLVILERKIDALSNASKPPRESRGDDRYFKEKRFSKPFRPFKHSHQHKKDFRPHSREEDSSGEQGFKKHHGDDKRGFGPKKKKFFFKKSF